LLIANTETAQNALPPIYDKLIAWADGDLRQMITNLRASFDGAKQAMERQRDQAYKRVGWLFERSMVIRSVVNEKQLAKIYNDFTLTEDAQTALLNDLWERLGDNLSKIQSQSSSQIVDTCSDLIDNRDQVFNGVWNRSIFDALDSLTDKGQGMLGNLHTLTSSLLKFDPDYAGAKHPETNRYLGIPGDYDKKKFPGLDISDAQIIKTRLPHRIDSVQVYAGISLGSVRTFFESYKKAYEDELKIHPDIHVVPMKSPDQPIQMALEELAQMKEEEKAQPSVVGMGDGSHPD
jgi:hypothetical protein